VDDCSINIILFYKLSSYIRILEYIVVLHSTHFQYIYLFIFLSWRFYWLSSLTTRVISRSKLSLNHSSAINWRN